MKTYTVEIANMPSDMLSAKNPKEALEKYLKKYKIKYKKIQAYEDKYVSQIVAKVCLLGGVRESISYYTVFI